jgi:hypothetical protein
MAKVQNAANKLIKPKVARPGVHAKTQTSVSKQSKNYKKQYKGQGR